jgi:crotonobetainyl-CoA:carnitine CoA-transferase CaiB-like acyl-CoA transferase
VSRINSIADIVADPQFQARGMIVAVEDERLERPLLVPGVVPKLSRTPGQVPHLARPLGADTDAVRRRLGRTWRAGRSAKPDSVANSMLDAARDPAGHVSTGPASKGG